MDGREELASSRFHCTASERCAFETGIKLATVYHQFVGTPFDASSVEGLEECIRRCISAQPYVVDASVSIDRSVIPADRDVYSYVSLTGDMIDATVTVFLDGVTMTGEMRYDRELGYPLMYISSTATD